jgi:hypothetical protein
MQAFSADGSAKMGVKLGQNGWLVPSFAIRGVDGESHCAGVSYFNLGELARELAIDWLHSDSAMGLTAAQTATTDGQALAHGKLWRWVNYLGAASILGCFLAGSSFERRCSLARKACSITGMLFARAGIALRPCTSPAKLRTQCVKANSAELIVRAC